MSEQPYYLLMDEHGNVTYKDVSYEKYKKLLDERDALQAQLDGLKQVEAYVDGDPNDFSYSTCMSKYNELLAERDALQAKLDSVEEIVHQIDNWARAYPLDIFPEPDFKKARKLLEAGGMTLDSISASNMRHVIEGVKDLVAQALKKLEFKNNNFNVDGQFNDH